MRSVLVAAALVGACGDDDGGGGSSADGGGGGDTGWEQLADLPSGPVQETAVVEVAGVIYVLGGIDGAVQTLPQVLAYHPADDSWDRATDLPAAVHHVNAAAVDDTVYVIGSLAPDFSPVAEVWSWTPGDRAWSTGRTPMPAPARGAATGWTARSPMPTARGGIASAVVDGRIAVVGGEGNRDTASGVFPQTEIYDPDADAWDSLADMPTPRHGMAAAGLDGGLYVPGGADHQSFGAVATHEVLRLR
jgi:N-acetylneuraminic acid mutarotase